MIYFDNAATSNFKPKEVVEAVNFAIKNLCVNAGRSGHSLSIESGLKIANARTTAQKFFNGYTNERTIFTKNCTEALNIALLGTIRQNGHIITSMNEHNSILRPLFELERAKIISLSVLQPNKDGTVSASDIQKNIRKNTYLVALSHASNVTGATNDIEEIGNTTKKYGLIFVVDCAQSAGHIPIDMKKMNIDILCTAGHKGLLGIQGSGLLLFNETLKISPITFGGTGTYSEILTQPETYPECLESGTIGMPAILSVDAGIKWLNENGKKHTQKLFALQSFLFENIKDIPKVKIFSKPNQCGIVSFLIDGYSSTEICDYLNDNYSIALRCGLHCAPLIHKHLGTTNSGLIRASLSGFNYQAEVLTLIDALNTV